jgi:hypothetical protein
MIASEIRRLFRIVGEQPIELLVAHYTAGQPGNHDWQGSVDDATSGRLLPTYAALHEACATAIIRCAPAAWD